MANFLDFTRVTYRDAVKTLYYICGPEVVLREQALDLIRAKVKPAPEEVSVVSAAECSGGEVWDEVMSYAEVTTRRFVVVRDAERLTYWDPFWVLAEALRTREAPVVTAVFLSAHPDFGETTCPRGHTTKPLERKGRGGRSVKVCGDCSAIRDKIAVLRQMLLVELGRPTEEAALKIVAGSFPDNWKGWAVTTPERAHELLDYVGWDLTAARDACRRASACEVPILPQTIPLLAVRGVESVYVEALTQLDKLTAVAAAYGMSPDEGRRAVGQLERRLDILTRLNRVLRRAETTQGLASRLGIHYAVINALKPHAKHYDSIRVERDSLALMQADAALATGGGDGALELLALQW